MAHSGANDYAGGPSDLIAAERDAAREALDDGGVVRIALPGRRLALCTSMDDVKAAQRGRIPAHAVRLDRGELGAMVRITSPDGRLDRGAK